MSPINQKEAAPDDRRAIETCLLLNPERPSKRNRLGQPQSLPQRVTGSVSTCPLEGCPFSATNRAATAFHLNTEHAASSATLSPEFLASQGLGRCEVCHRIGSCGNKCMRSECIGRRVQGPGSPVPEAPPSPSALTLEAMCKAPWTTVLLVPSALLDQWLPLEETLLRVFMCSKLRVSL